LTIAPGSHITRQHLSKAQSKCVAVTTARWPSMQPESKFKLGWSSSANHLPSAAAAAGPLLLVAFAPCCAAAR
jgi:hypothetical protein